MIKQLHADKQVQTGLAVEVDGVVVEYAELPDTYGYRLFIRVGEKADHTKVGDSYGKVMAVIDAMISQANNKGSNWRVKKIVADESRVEGCGEYSVDVEFYIDEE